MKLVSALLVGAMLLAASLGASSPIVVTAQILDYEKGYLFFTTGDGFKVSPHVDVVNGPVEPPRYARVTFSDAGVVTKIQVSQTKLPPEGNLADVHKFAVALSPFKPNPALDNPQTGGLCQSEPGKRVLVSITVQVPPSTRLTDQVYMTTDQAAWNPQAYKMDRVDALHYRLVLTLNSGTVMHVLFDRGSSQSIQVGENGLEQKPYLLCVGDSNEQLFQRTVYRWGDETTPGNPVPAPQTMPTPYNPAPFPNLPTPPGTAPTPLPNRDR